MRNQLEKKTSNNSASYQRQTRKETTTTNPSVKVIASESVAARAYALWLNRGGGHGDDWNDWFQAEQDLLKRLKR